jgi:predicted transcriptional regulator
MGLSMTEAVSKEELIEHVADIVAAYVTNKSGPDPEPAGAD